MTTGNNVADKYRIIIFLNFGYVFVINPFTVKIFNGNFHPLEVVSRVEAETVPT